LGSGSGVHAPRLHGGQVFVYSPTAPLDFT
jgi:hypothetical protein